MQAQYVYIATVWSKALPIRAVTARQSRPDGKGSYGNDQGKHRYEHLVATKRIVGF